MCFFIPCGIRVAPTPSDGSEHLAVVVRFDRYQVIHSNEEKDMKMLKRIVVLNIILAAISSVNAKAVSDGAMACNLGTAVDGTNKDQDGVTSNDSTSKETKSNSSRVD